MNIRDSERAKIPRNRKNESQTRRAKALGTKDTSTSPPKRSRLRNLSKDKTPTNDKRRKSKSDMSDEDLLDYEEEEEEEEEVIPQGVIRPNEQDTVPASARLRDKLPYRLLFDRTERPLHADQPGNPNNFLDYRMADGPHRDEEKRHQHINQWVTLLLDYELSKVRLYSRIVITKENGTYQ